LLVHVVHDLHFVAELLADALEGLEDVADVFVAIEERRGVKNVGPLRSGTAATRAAEIEPDGAVTQRLRLTNALGRCTNAVTACTGVEINRLARLATEQLIDGETRLASLDVPQRLIHAADRVVQHRPVAPVRAVVHRLPGVLDAVRRAPEQEG